MSGLATSLRGITGAPVLGIVGWKKSGKTTLVVSLVAELTRRGRCIATIKHAHHDIQIDADETDSARHRRAGAVEAAVVSPHRWAIVSDTHETGEPRLEDIIARLAPCDLILVEGHKRAPIPKIEVRRQAAETQQPLAGTDNSIIAIVSDMAVSDAGLPVFDPDDIDGLVAFIERTFLPSATPDGRSP